MSPAMTVPISQELAAIYEGAISGVTQREISAAWSPINVWFEHSVEELIHRSRYTQLLSHSYHGAVK